MEIGDYIKQTGNDFVSYGLIVKQTKKSFIAIVFTSYDGRVKGKASLKSLNTWHPRPIKINPIDIPDRILGKINSRKEN